jgi:hypothetical protein
MAMKGNGHVERPLACDFEQIVWRPYYDRHGGD